MLGPASCDAAAAVAATLASAVSPPTAPANDAVPALCVVSAKRAVERAAEGDRGAVSIVAAPSVVAPG